jgi:uncharacterized protein
VRVAVDDDIGGIAVEELPRSGAAELVTVAHVNLEAPGVDLKLRLERRVRGIDVAVHRPDRGDPLERLEDRRAADVAGVENLGNPGECREHAVPQKTVGIRDEADYDGSLIMRLCDVHCHFFSTRFLELLTGALPDLPEADRAIAVSHRLGWDDPGSAEALADRWAAELDRHDVARAAVIASIPGDEDSVAAAVRRHPSRFVGFFMFNPMQGDPGGRLRASLGGLGLRGICLFPAMHGYRLDDQQVRDVFAAAAAHGAVVFVHCGVLTVGVRKKLGLPSPFDLRLGDPLALATTAARFPNVRVIVPHFGAGLFRELLMAVEQCPNIHMDSSSSNGWMRYHPGLTLDAVFRQALAVAGAERILFGTDSSFFPRGWQKPIYDSQEAALAAAGASDEDRAKIFGGNFERLFPSS